MNKEISKRIDVIAENLSSLAEQIKTLPQGKDVAGSLPVISSVLKMQAKNLAEISKELNGSDE